MVYRVTYWTEYFYESENINEWKVSPKRTITIQALSRDNVRKRILDEYVNCHQNILDEHIIYIRNYRIKIEFLDEYTICQKTVKRGW